MDVRVLRMKSKRDAKSAVVAALVAVCLPQLLLTPFFAIGLRDSVAGYDAAVVYDFSITVLKVTVGHLIFPGLIVFLWLYHRGRLTWYALGGAGYVVGLLAGLFWAFFDLPEIEFAQILLQAGFWGPMGALLGLSFWVVWRPLSQLASGSTGPIE